MNGDIHPSWSDFATAADESALPELWQGLAGLWCPALGRSGDRLFDLGGRRHHGTLCGMDPAAARLPTKMGSALQFDGVNGYANLGDPDELRFGGAFTLVWYGYATSAGPSGSALLAKVGGSTQRACGMILTSDKLCIFQAPNAATYAAYVVSISRSYPDADLFVATFEPGARLALYQNGGLVGEKSSGVYGPFFNTNGLPWCLMTRGDTVSKTAGNVLYAMMYARALPAAEVARLAADPFGLLRPRCRRPVAKRPPSGLGRIAAAGLFHAGAASGYTFTTGAAIGYAFTTGQVEGIVDA